MDPMTLFGRKIAVKKTGKKNTVLSSVYMLICSACKGVLVLVDFHMYAPNGSHRYSHPFSIFIKIGVLLRKKGVKNVYLLAWSKSTFPPCTMYM